MANIYSTKRLLEEDSFDKYKDYFREYSAQTKAGKVDASLIEYMLTGKLLPYKDFDFDQGGFEDGVHDGDTHSEELIVVLRDNTEITLHINGEMFEGRSADLPFEIDVEVIAVAQNGHKLELFRTQDRKYWFNQDRDWGEFLGW